MLPRLVVMLLVIIPVLRVQAQGFSGGQTGETTVVEQTIVSGATYLSSFGDRIKIEDVQVTAYSNDQEKHILAQTRSKDDGTYRLTIPVKTDRIILKGEREGFITRESVISGEQSLTKDIQLFVELNNSISGQVLDKNNSPVTGVSVVARNTLSLTMGTKPSLATTDKNGKYSIEGLAKGRYELKVLRNDDRDAPTYFTLLPNDSEVMVDLLHDVGEDIQRHLKINTINSTKSKLFVRVFEGNPIDDAFRGGEIRNVDLDLYAADMLEFWAKKKPRPPMPPPIVRKKSPAVFEDLEPGDYYIISAFKGEKGTLEVEVEKGFNYINARYDFPLACELDTEVITKLWLCGDEAKALVGNDSSYREIVYEYVLQTINIAHKRYPQFLQLPRQVIIFSDSQTNLIYDYVHKGTHCPPPVTNAAKAPPESERILLSSGLIKRYATAPLAIRNGIFHEFGHGVDFWLNNCSGWRSEQTDFHLLRTRGQAFGPLYFLNLTDSTYDRSDLGGGHPFKDNQETFASAFFIGNQYHREFNERLKGLPRELQNILTETVNTATKGTR